MENSLKAEIIELRHLCQILEYQISELEIKLSKLSSVAENLNNNDYPEENKIKMYEINNVPSTQACYNNKLYHRS